MKQIVLQIGFLALIAHTCKAAIIISTPNQEVIDRVHEATIDVLVRCFIGGGNAIGVIGDSDGFIEKLSTRHSIPVVIIDTTMRTDTPVSDQNRYRLQAVVIIAAARERFQALMIEFMMSMWWNNQAKFLVLSPTPDKLVQVTPIAQILYVAYFHYGVLSAQFIQFDGVYNVTFYDFNPYTDKAPKPWEIFAVYGTKPRPSYLFVQPYLKDDETCEALNFKKTSDLGGYPFIFMVASPWVFCHLTNTCDGSLAVGEGNTTDIDELLIDQYKWFVDTIAMAMNASAVINKHAQNEYWDISVIPSFYSDTTHDLTTDEMIHSFVQSPLFAMTQHTAHMSQLEKILSVIDKTSKIGMYVVYFVTFLFFKFFLRQAVIPAILNLVRLTCNIGMTKLPTNVAPTVYLACLFMFVITLQAIYTGNLASLLTTTIAYPHVDTKEDIPKLGYTVYAYNFVYNKIAADPVLDGRVVKINFDDPCENYVLRDPSAACIGQYYELITRATQLNLHLSRDPIQHDYYFYKLTINNPLARRVQEIVMRCHEFGLRRFDDAYTTLQIGLVDDDEVKKNTVRRIMNFDDLRFAFVILGIGEFFSIICFVVEILISYMSSRLAKRRDRVHSIPALAVIKKKSSWCTALKLRFSGLSLFSHRR